MDPAAPSSAIVPSLDGAVLTFLARRVEPVLAGEVADGVGASYNGVRPILDRLAEHGVVRLHRQGRSVAYSLNPHHVGLTVITALAELRATTIERLRDLVAAWEGTVASAILYGSFARADGDVHSDVDLLVVVDDDHDHAENVSRLASSIEGATGNDPQVVVLTREQVRALPTTNRSFAESLCRDGIVLRGASPVQLGLLGGAAA